MPIQLAQKFQHLTFSGLTQIILRRDQGNLCKPMATTKALCGNQQSRHSTADTIFVGAMPIKPWSVPQYWINKHLQRDRLTNIEHEVSQTGKLAQRRHGPAA